MLCPVQVQFSYPILFGPNFLIVYLLIWFGICPLQYLNPSSWPGVLCA